VNPDWIIPDWPAPAAVRACVTTREGGVSVAPYASLNLGNHVGDIPAHVAQNRARVRAALPVEPLWLRQTHGLQVADAALAQVEFEADASVARQRDQVCVVMTADCLPVLFCDQAGTVVGAAHAGWRGLADGILEQTVAAMQVPPGQIMAWLGPAIGPAKFEVGEEVRAIFVADLPGTSAAFQTGKPGKWLADIYQLARLRLARLGVHQVYGGGLCTYSDASRFYSYRRDGVTGRMASLIWLADS
jgi:hypothetical protein